MELFVARVQNRVGTEGRELPHALHWWKWTLCRRDERKEIRRARTASKPAKNEILYVPENSTQGEEVFYELEFHPGWGTSAHPGWGTLDDSFSSVWTATIARVDAFCSIFFNLQDVPSFAPLQTQILQVFCRFFAKFAEFNSANFANWFCKFCKSDCNNFSELLQNLLNFAKICHFSMKFQPNFFGIPGNSR